MKKCTKILNARAGPLFFSLNPIVLSRCRCRRRSSFLNSLLSSARDGSSEQRPSQRAARNAGAEGTIGKFEEQRNLCRRTFSSLSRQSLLVQFFICTILPSLYARVLRKKYDRLQASRWVVIINSCYVYIIRKGKMC